MNVITTERTVFFDVDDTLIMHAEPDITARGKETFVDILDPLDPTNKITLAINKNMVRLLKEEFCRESHVVVWSRGGYQWATNVVLALGLQSYVHTVMTKPAVYFDDKDVSEWMNYRVYIGPKEHYK